MRDNARSEYESSPELIARFIKRAETVAIHTRDLALFWKGVPAKNVYLVLDGEVEQSFPNHEDKFARYTFRMSVESILAQLKQERDRIDAAIRRSMFLNLAIPA